MNKILIGFLNEEIKGAIPTITKAFIDGLSKQYEFIPFYMNRKYPTIRTKINIINIYYLIKHYIQWVYALVKHKPDIVHYPITSYWNLEKSLLFLSTAKVFGVRKVVGHLHGGAFDSFWTNLPWLRKSLCVSQIKNLDSIIVLSEYWKYFIINNIDIDIDKVFVVNNPVESQLEKSFEDFKRNYNTDKLSILSISGLTTRKGILDSLKALKNIEYVQYSIVGPEIETGIKNKIKKYLVDNDLANNVELFGAIYKDNKYLLLKKSDLFLLPSYIENFPLAIIEAACAGLPIITTPVGALPEFFKHMENVYYVESGNTGQIENAIKYLLDSPNERERLGQAARKVFVNKLSRITIMEQLKIVYENTTKT